MEVIDLTKPVLMPIPGYEGQYSATRGGRIYRHAKKNVKAGWIKERRNREYSQIPLNIEGQGRKWLHVHRLVAMAFIANPENKPQVNHKNCNKHDNRVANLEWVTKRENWEHARDNGRYRGRMLDEAEKIDLYRQSQTQLYSRSDLATMFNISRSSVDRHIKYVQALQPIRLAA